MIRPLFPLIGGTRESLHQARGIPFENEKHFGSPGLHLSSAAPRYKNTRLKSASDIISIDFHTLFRCNWRIGSV